jgi:hypothetical protein
MAYWTLKSLKALTVSCICCILIACGGGGGSSTETGGNSPTEAGGDNSADSSNPSNSPDLELSWLMPDAREDGQDLEAYEINGYLIYYTSSDIPMLEADSITISDAQTTDYSFTDLQSGNYRLAIATVDTQGILSALSDEMTARIP